MKLYFKIFYSFVFVVFAFVLLKPAFALADATITLENSVTNDNGGTALATDWHLTASPMFVGGTNLTGIMGSAGVTNASVVAGTYFLNQWGGGGPYTYSDWTCNNGISVIGGNSITLSNGQSTTCTIVENDMAPQLHLRNVVINNDGGTSTITDWTLNATGAGGSPTNISGATQLDSTSTLKADTYTLGSSGPANYTTSAWVCTIMEENESPFPVVNNTITLTLAQVVTCTVTQDDTGPAVVFRPSGHPIITTSVPAFVPPAITPIVVLPKIETSMANSAVISATDIFTTPGFPKTGISDAKVENVNTKEGLQSGGIKTGMNIIISKIKVNSAVESVGVTLGGNMDVPLNTNDVGWFNKGVVPGEIGSAVIDGHSGLSKKRPAVFDNLNKLKKGNIVTIKNEKGESINFVVQKTKVYNSNANTKEVFVSNDGKAHLNLITCAGSWNKKLGTHNKRLVVFTEKQD